MYYCYVYTCNVTKNFYYSSPRTNEYSSGVSSDNIFCGLCCCDVSGNIVQHSWRKICSTTQETGTYTLTVSIIGVNFYGKGIVAGNVHCLNFRYKAALKAYFCGRSPEQLIVVAYCAWLLFECPDFCGR